MARQSWLDERTQQPLIDHYTQQLGTFMDAMADGVITDDELREQEQRLVNLMKEVEPKLDDVQHAQVTKLLCELAAYNIMQALNSFRAAQPKTKFRG